MYFVEFLSSRVWLFLVAIGKMCQVTLADVIDGVSYTVSNPFNEITWDISLSNDFVSVILDWLTETLSIPPTFTVLDCLLFVFATIFALSMLVRLYSMITPD